MVQRKVGRVVVERKPSGEEREGCALSRRFLCRMCVIYWGCGGGGEGRREEGGGGRGGRVKENGEVHGVVFRIQFFVCYFLSFCFSSFLNQIILFLFGDGSVLPCASKIKKSFIR